jgi:hypothetical protein
MHRKLDFITLENIMPAELPSYKRCQYCSTKASSFHSFTSFLTVLRHNSAEKKFFLFSKNINQYGFNGATWNFLESSHGKGPADEVGGAVKRTLDSKVIHGHDISDAKTTFQVLSQTYSSIFFFIFRWKLLKP